MKHYLTNGLIDSALTSYLWHGIDGTCPCPTQQPQVVPHSVVRCKSIAYLTRCRRRILFLLLKVLLGGNVELSKQSSDDSPAETSSVVSITLSDHLGPLLDFARFASLQQACKPAALFPASLLPECSTPSYVVPANSTERESWHATQTFDPVNHACICGTLPLPCSGWVQ